MIDKIKVGDVLHDIRDNSITESIRQISDDQIREWSLDDIAISPTEPTENKTKVWLQIPDPNENLADLSTFVDGAMKTDGTFVTTHIDKGRKRSGYIEIEPNTTYEFKIIETNDNYDNWFAVADYTANKTCITRRSVEGIDATRIIFTTGTNAKYIVVSSHNLQNATKIQLRKYTSEKIYVLNDENVYEEYIKNNIVDYASRITKNNTYCSNFELKYGVVKNGIAYVAVSLTPASVSLSTASYTFLEGLPIPRSSFETFAYTDASTVSSKFVRFMVNASGALQWWYNAAASLATNQTIIVNVTYPVAD